MHEAQAGWLVGTRDAWIVLGVWLAAALIFAVARSVGQVKQDPIRPSGPVF